MLILPTCEEYETADGRQYTILELDNDGDRMRLNIEDEQRSTTRRCEPRLALRQVVRMRNALVRAGYHQVAV